MEPTSPSSSAPQNAKRTALATGGAEPSCTAVSSSVAVPEPLSLIPGPAGTESRCAPANTTWSGLPVPVWAITLRLRFSSTVVFSTSDTGAPARANSGSPSARASPAVGTVPVAPSPRVPSDSGPSALFTTSTAAAPAVAATVDFWANVQVPRRTRTTEPAGTPASAAASQPSPAATASGAVTPPAAVAGE